MNIAAHHDHIDTVGRAMVDSSPPGWRRVTLDVTAAANMTKTSLAVELEDGRVDSKLTIDSEGAIACDELRESMYQEGKGTWYNARFVIDESQQVNAEFDYDGPPFGGVADDDDPDSEGDADPELLLEDQRMFPRDPDLLPEWHPARTSPDV